MRLPFTLLICSFQIISTAHADILRPNASCASIAEVMDGQDRQRIGYAVQLIADTLAEADQPFIKAKRGSVIELLSDDGLTNVVALVISRCRAGKNATAREAAVNTYTSLRALQTAAGTLR